MWRRSLFVMVAIAIAAVGIGPGAVASSSPSHASGVAGLRAVSCATASVCIATGDSTQGEASIIGTSDAGRTWVQLATPRNAAMLDGVACATPLSCKAVGDTSDDQGAIFGTGTGAQSWRAEHAPLPGGVFLAVACPARLACEATGTSGAVFGTVDAGRTWTQQTAPRRALLVYGLSCPTTAVCEGVAYTGQLDESVIAIRTLNGGRTWTAQHVPRSPRTQLLNAVSCATVMVCAAVGSFTYDAGSKSAGLLIRTTDGGKSWTRLPLPGGVSALVAVACASPNRCEAVGVGAKLSAIGTTDGTTWRARGIPPVGLRGVACPQPAVCEAVGSDENGHTAIFGTVDSGRTWARQFVRTR